MDTLPNIPASAVLPEPQGMASQDPTNSATPSPVPPSVDERRALIERVAASDQFSRSARLRDFLLYVGRQSLKEGCPEIHEEDIGVRVFGRPVSYDRSQDNIVRVNATELRKRVDAWFAGPGAGELLIFEIPRGAYKPVFRRRMQAGPTSQPAVPALLAEEAPARAAPVSAVPAAYGAVPASVAPRAWKRPAWERPAWIGLTLALAALSGVLFFENRSLRTAFQPAPSQPAVVAFWKDFLDPHRQTDLVLPDDSVSIIEDITGGPITLDNYVTRDFMRRIQSSNLSADRRQDVRQVYNHNLVTFGAVRAAQAVLAQVPAAYPRYLTLARNFSADELNRSNVVFIGGEKAMPWDRLLDDMLNFSTDFDYKAGVAFVRNRNPKPGEPPVFALSSSPDSITGYAVIAYLPNPSRTGHVLLLAGTDSDATGAAAAFLSSEPQMEKLRATLHATQPGKRFPYFEVVLRVPRVSGTFFDPEPIAWRTYPNLQ